MPFYAPDGMTPDEQERADTQEFLGTGTPYLEVPGLTRVTAVRVGNQELPLTAPLKFPVTAGGELYTCQDPLVSLQRNGNGVPVLLRNTRSNDGIWQKDCPIYVSGEWEKVAAAKTKVAA